MGAGHGHRLHFHGHSVVHRAAPHHKILALLAFVLAVVATPAGWWPLFVVALGVLLGVVLTARVPLRFLLPRMVVEVPFLVFALVIPFVATGPRVDLGPVSLSEPGLVAAALLAVKGTLGVLASLTLAATTEPVDVLRGLERLRLPATLVQILGFMIRYLDVVTADLGRMRRGLVARGFDARNPRHWPVLARTVGALFVRSYERGERVHLAMVARGLPPGGSMTR
ncbi:cobalt ECF transporter T component CbiQ [Nocardioides sp. HDW12B]|uniref:cobalt ECF transporter T component CbiQ n=1 Tax=Nocardioides sp. HDW12B TaxID=2714939 RepID=UPI00140B32BF|nr:cobalt ECF transporter T component CbiQ [Nocardioides sp. HDW12B]QIK65715.1 cobalt ECF transporter T component CbiQ [Nocardioides sp. HDW12B]